MDQSKTILQVSFDEVFRLGKHEGKLEALEKKTDSNSDDIADLEQRVIKLENWQWKVIGIATLGVPIAAYLVNLIV